MTPLETKATNQIEAATQADEIIWNANPGGFTGRYRGAGLFVDTTAGKLLINSTPIATYDPTPLLTKINNKLDRQFKQVLRQIAGDD